MKLLFPLLSLLLPAAAGAQVLIDPSSVAPQGQTRAALVFASSEVEYEINPRPFGTTDIERKTLGLELGFGVAPSIDFALQAGMIMDTEIENVNEDGDGFTFGVGLRGLVHRTPSVRIVTYGIFAYQAEEVEVGSSKIEMTSYDMHLGVTASFPLAAAFHPYVGFDLVAVDDGKFKVKSGTLSTENDMERDDITAIKLGANLLLGALTVRPEVTLLGEQTILVAAASTF